MRRRPAVTRRKALSLWKDDALRRARSVDPDAITDAVLRLAPEQRATERAARRYASAAAVLIGLGAAGSVALSFVGGPEAGAAPATLGSIEDERLRVAGVEEILSLPLAKPSAERTTKDGG